MIHTLFDAKISGNHTSSLVGLNEGLFDGDRLGLFVGGAVVGIDVVGESDGLEVVGSKLGESVGCAVQGYFFASQHSSTLEYMK